MDALVNFDTDLFLWLNSLHCEAMDSVMVWISSRTLWVPLYVVLLVCVGHRYGWRRAIAVVVLAGLAVLIADQVCASVIRPMVGRLRPSNLDNPISSMVHVVNGHRGGRFGFPSCHASNLTAVAVLLACVLRSRVWWCVLPLWAVLGMYSRIYLGVHYPGDLFVGCLVGICSGYVVYRLYAWLSEAREVRMGRYCLNLRNIMGAQPR